MYVHGVKQQNILIKFIQKERMRVALANPKHSGRNVARNERKDAPMLRIVRNELERTFKMNEHNRNITILKEIQQAFGDLGKHFFLSLDEVLVSEEFYYSVLVRFAPKMPNNNESKIKQGIEEHRLQFDLEEFSEVGQKDSYELTLILGEDTRTAVTSGNIHTQLYWYEITEEA